VKFKSKTLTTNGYLIGLNTDCIYWNKEKV